MKPTLADLKRKGFIRRIWDIYVISDSLEKLRKQRHSYASKKNAQNQATRLVDPNNMVAVSYWTSQPVLLAWPPLNHWESASNTTATADRKELFKVLRRLGWEHLTWQHLCHLSSSRLQGRPRKDLIVPRSILGGRYTPSKTTKEQDSNAGQPRRMAG